MLRGLRFKNWRSLKDVTIDNLTPITVFVGANSTGKTNMCDGLAFIRDVLKTPMIEQVMYWWQGYEKLHFSGTDLKEPIELELSFDASEHLAKYAIKLDQTWPIALEETLDDSMGPYAQSGNFSTLIRENGKLVRANKTDDEKSPLAAFNHVGHPPIQKLFQYVTERWQILKENFAPTDRLSANSRIGGGYSIDPQATNLPFLLDFLRVTKPMLFEALQADLSSLLEHVATISTQRTEIETKISIKEKTLSGAEAFTISAGTARIIAMLTAYYALDIRNAEQPGLVVIEEPDTAVHPLLLGNLVDLLRSYTAREQPRQFILTTHNPAFLNYFKPEEVRIVERDEQGVTTVHEVNRNVANVWYEKYGDYNLGEIWKTRLLGGVPE